MPKAPVLGAKVSVFGRLKVCRVHVKMETSGAWNGAGSGEEALMIDASVIGAGLAGGGHYPGSRCVSRMDLGDGAGVVRRAVRGRKVSSRRRTAPKKPAPRGRGVQQLARSISRKSGRPATNRQAPVRKRNHRSNVSPFDVFGPPTRSGSVRFIGRSELDDPARSRAVNEILRRRGLRKAPRSESNRPS